MAQLHLDRNASIAIVHLQYTSDSWCTTEIYPLAMGILLLAEDLWHLHQPLFGGLHDAWSSCCFFFVAAGAVHALQ